jgi:hypothetical protein
MEGRTSLAGVNEKLGNGVDRNVSHTSDGPHGRPFAEHGEDLNAGFEGRLIHTEIMLERISIVKPARAV